MDELQKALEHARACGLSDRDIAVVVRGEADRVRFQRDTENVTLVHPEVAGEISVHPDAVEQHEMSGWQPKPQADAESGPVSKPAGRQAQKEK